MKRSRAILIIATNVFVESDQGCRGGIRSELISLLELRRKLQPVGSFFSTEEPRSLDVEKFLRKVLDKPLQPEGVPLTG